MVRELEPKVKELSENGNIIYSFSKLGTFNNCEYSYYQTYIHGDRGIDNVYSLMGNVLHKTIQDITDGVKDESILINTVEDALAEMELLNINFPNEKIKNAWTNDVIHYCKNYKKPKQKIKSETGFLLEIFPKVWLQGYIDAITVEEDGSLNIYDYKTSSKFDKEKLQEAGRQLILYAYAKEQEGFKINKIAWLMVKYIYVCWKLKNGKINKKMCNRSKWVKEIYNPLEKELSKLGYDDFEIPMMIDESIEKNNLDNMPKEIRDKYSLEDCILEYPYTKELKEELIKYIKNTHEQIVKKDFKNEEDWQPIEITEKTNFFCFHLCNQRRTCKYLRMYIDEQDFEKKEAVDEMTELFG